MDWLISSQYVLNKKIFCFVASEIGTMQSLNLRYLTSASPKLPELMCVLKMNWTDGAIWDLSTDQLVCVCVL